MGWTQLRFFRLEMKDLDGHRGFSYHQSEKAAFAKAKRFESERTLRDPFTKVVPIEVNLVDTAVIAMMNRYASHPKREEGAE